MSNKFLPPVGPGRAASLWHSFGYALAGMRYVLLTQRNAQIHAGITLAVIGLGLFLRISVGQWAILVLTIGVVMAAEMFNTALEATVDLVSPDHHPLAKIAKDAAAGAVFALALIAMVVGACILGPPLWLMIIDLL
jgi:undecaprenol kinase/diacylglycerol kinase (ATP)